MIRYLLDEGRLVRVCTLAVQGRRRLYAAMAGVPLPRWPARLLHRARDRRPIYSCSLEWHKLPIGKERTQSRSRRYATFARDLITHSS